MARSNQEIAAAAAAHSYGKHAAEFGNSKFGGKRGTTVPVKSQADLSAHVERILSDPKTRTFEGPSSQPQRAARFHYHYGSNTMLTVPNNSKQAPTVYRPPTGFKKFKRKFNDARVIDKAAPKLQRSVEQSRGVNRSQAASRSTAPNRTPSPARTAPSRSGPSRTTGRSPSRGGRSR